MHKTAVVLFNLGGPDSLETVRLFLFNLFNDPAIIDLPAPVRWLVAQAISRRRATVARDIYAHLGGGSPLLSNTVAQAEALEAELQGRWHRQGREARVFVAMRYWHPRSDETARKVRGYGPDELVLLPLYPQFSTTTTGSSLRDWHEAAGSVSLQVPSKAVCCYPVQPGFISAVASRIRPALAEASRAGRPRVLLSAHGLPKKIVAAGDPYQWQTERTAAAIVEALKSKDRNEDGFDWVVCYQSRVGPLEWIGPYTDAEIERAGRDGVPVVVAPIAFVSEHSETLVELDIDYRRLAGESGVPLYVRAPTVGTAAGFVGGLADLVITTLSSGTSVCSASGARTCPANHGQCAHGPA